MHIKRCNKYTRIMFFDHNSIDIDEFCAWRARTDVVRCLQSWAAVLPFTTFLRRDAFSSRYRGKVTKWRQFTRSKNVYLIIRHVYETAILSSLCYLSSISGCKADSPKESEARLNLTPSRQIFWINAAPSILNTNACNWWITIDIMYKQHIVACWSDLFELKQKINFLRRELLLSMTVLKCMKIVIL